MEHLGSVYKEKNYNIKMFLTSTIFFNDIVTKKVFNYIDKPIEKCKVLFIPNEKATREKLDSRKYIDRVIEWGFTESNIYIFNRYEPEKFKNLDIDILTISGGNTFLTLEILKETGFDKEIVKYVKNGVIYIGGSAGSHVVTKNIKHVEKYDENISSLKSLDAICLFDGILICHYNESRKDDYLKLLNESEYNVYSLTDNEFLLCNNNDVIKINVE